MTVIMRKDLDERCLLQIPASSVFGDGVLYVTNLAVVYEVLKRGIYLNFVPRNTILGLDVSKSGMFGAKKCRLKWTEDGSVHHMELRIKRCNDLKSKLSCVTDL